MPLCIHTWIQMYVMYVCGNLVTRVCWTAQHHHHHRHHGCQCKWNVTPPLLTVISYSFIFFSIDKIHSLCFNVLLLSIIIITTTILNTTSTNTFTATSITTSLKYCYFCYNCYHYLKICSFRQWKYQSGLLSDSLLDWLHVWVFMNARYLFAFF